VPIATTGSSGTFAITATEARHPIAVQARGFVSTTFAEVQVRAGKTLHKNLALARNLASSAQGAVSVAGNAGRAMDDTEASSWRTAKGINAVIKLAKQAKVTRAQVSGYTNSRFEGLKSFTVQTCTDAMNGRPGPSAPTLSATRCRAQWFPTCTTRPLPCRRR
jgi:hypothetical protein